MSVLGLLQFGWNALFKCHVLVGLYNGECFRSFRTLAFHESDNNDKMLVSASWVCYSLDRMHFTGILFATQ